MLILIKYSAYLKREREREGARAISVNTDRRMRQQLCTG